MRPPICAICDKRFTPSETEGGLVSCRLTVEEAKRNERFEQEGFVGHPEGREWFCGKHIKVARKNKHLTFKELRKKIRDGEEEE